MLGTLQLARALTDRDQSDQLLDRGVETAIKLLNDPAWSARGPIPPEGCMSAVGSHGGR
jgi:hypothetical protein